MNPITFFKKKSGTRKTPRGHQPTQLVKYTKYGYEYTTTNDPIYTR